jgi:NADH-quinone oxidoreductase subunit C
MNDLLQTVTQTLQEKFSAQVQEFRSEVTVMLSPEHNVEALQTLRDDFHFEMLVDVTAVDYWPEEAPRFHINYQLYSMSQNMLLRLRVPLKGNTPSLRSVEKIYPSANWYEREVFDMFGVRFEGHSDMRRIIMPADWEGHPLRKDYPLGYEEVQFTFNFDQIKLRKTNPKS